MKTTLAFEWEPLMKKNVVKRWTHHVNIKSKLKETVNMLLTIYRKMDLNGNRIFATSCS